MVELVKTRLVALGDIAEFVRGITFKPTDVAEGPTDTNVDCLRTKNVQASLDTRDVWAIDPSFVKRPNQYVTEGDILISSANSWNLVGKCSWIPRLERPTAFGGFVTVLRRRDDSVDSRYLFHWFSSDRVQRTIRSFGNQTTNISNLDLKRSASLTVPLPPIEEQRRIAAILDNAEEIRLKRRAALKILDELILSFLQDAVGVAPTLIPLEACVERIIDYRGKSPRKTNTGVPLITAKIIKNGEILPAQEFIAIEDYDKWMTRGLPEIGDVLFTSEAPLGAVAQIDKENVALAQRVMLLRPDPRVVLGAYLMHVLTYPSVKEELRRRATGSTVLGIRQAELRKVLIPVPHRDSQRSFERRVAVLARLRNTHRAHLSQMDRLFASLQHRAFRGEL